MAKQHWFEIGKELTPRRSATALILGFLLPIAIWSAVSYVPWIWHPEKKVTDPGGSEAFVLGQHVPNGQFAAESARLRSAGKAPLEGTPANPIFLPAPHEVARALFTAFTTEPRRPGEPWLHESLGHSLRVILWGFLLSALFGVPLGILCGAFGFFSRLIEPFTDFIRYMPAPAFGALAVAVLGIADAPKVAIIFIGTYFQMVLVVANTTRLLDGSLIEAAQTLGADRRQLLTRVVIPGILPNLYNDLRILLGWAWTYLIVAELIGATSGISYFINQQGKYRNYDNVFAGILIIGVVGLATDQVLAALRRVLFPWQDQAPGRLVRILRRLRRARATPLPAPQTRLGRVEGADIVLD